MLTQLPIDVDDAQTDLAGIVSDGHQHTLGSYDASYLVLAERLGLSLATLDQRLAVAADQAGVHLLIEQ